MATSVGSVGPLIFEGKVSVRYSRLFVAASGSLPLPALAQQQQIYNLPCNNRLSGPSCRACSSSASSVARCRIRSSSAGVKSLDGTVCYIYLPITAAHSPPTASGYVQYGPNTIGSMSCFAAPGAGGPSATTSRPSAGTPPRTPPSPAVPPPARPPAAPAAPTQER